MKLSKKNIDAAIADEGRPKYLWDQNLAGFGVKVLPTGKKRYVVKYRAYGGGRTATQRWMTIGTHGEVPLDTARDHAQQILAAVKRGEDPQGNKFALRNAPRLSDVWEKFSTGELLEKKPSTIRDYSSNWSNLIKPALGTKLVTEISKSDVDCFHRSMSKTPYAANRVLALLSKLMTLSEMWEWRDQGTNPCRYIKKNKEESRERFLSIAELSRLGDAMRELIDEDALWPDMANAITLLLLTGARKNELLTCEWSWVSFETCSIALPDSKTGRKTLYLSEHAVRLLQSQQEYSRDPDSKYVFPGQRKGQCLVNISKPWGRICNRAKLEDVRLHDLRHTAASVAVGEGVSLPIIGRLLGHSQPQTTARYAHVDRDPAVFAANAIGEVITGTLGKKSNDKK
ncbi:MAG: site-specific integrase [Sulfitobacter sp.]